MANSSETGIFPAPYTSRQRAVSLTLGAAWSIPLTSTMAMANTPMPFVQHAVNGGAHTYVAPTFHTTSTSLLHGAPVAVHTTALSASTPTNFNLASSSLNFLANNLGNFNSLSIDVGGHQQQVSLTTKLTAAEVVAAEQVIAGGTQTIKIGANGVATGGTINLNSNLLTALDNSVGGSLSSLTIAHGVQVVDSVSNLSLSGSLNNRGSLLTASGSAGNTDIISANSISNAAGGSVGSYGGGSGLFAADPSLSASTSITNNGSISSAGNLTLSAPSVVNASVGGATATINAAHNVNINTQSLSNTGTIAAAAGNVNVASTGALSIAGSGGTIQANNGNINVTSGNADINVEGSNMLSQQVNFNSGSGDINASLDNVPGLVNATGNDVHISANTANLNLGNIDASGGDPAMASTGNLIIGAITATGGAPLTLIASGDILSGTGNTGLVTSGATGGQLNLIAGATFTGTAGGPGPFTVTKGDATGGLIDLSGGNGGTGVITSINTSGTAGVGGSIQMIAFAGTAAGSGTINVPTNVAINAAGTTTNGAVTLIAGAKSGTAISTGAIVGSTVALDTSTPIVSSKGVTFDTTGAQTAGTFTATATGNAANATVGNVTGTLSAISGGKVTVANTTSTLALGTVSLGKTGSLLASDTGGNIAVDGVITGAAATLTTTGSNTITMGTTGTPSINTTVTNINSGTGADVLTTDGATLVLNTNGAVTDTQGLATLGVSGTVGGASALTIGASGQVNLNGPLFVPGGVLSVTTTAADNGGISVAAPIFLNGGSVTLDSLGKGLLTETAGNILTAANVTLESITNIGSKTAPFATFANNLTVNDAGTKNITYISDTNTGNLVFSGNAGLPAGGSIFLTSTASKLSVNSIAYNTVSISDTVANANAAGVVFGTGNFGGTGTFTVLSANGIGAVAGTNIEGSTVTMTVTAPGASIGTVALPIGVASANLALNSSQGNVYVVDSQAVTVNGAASLTGVFSVKDTALAPALKGTATLTVGKSVGGGTIDLTTTGTATGTGINLTGTTGTATTANVNINSASNLTTKGAINGANIGFTTAGTVSFGGAVGNSSSSLSFNNTGTAPVTLSGILTGNSISFTSAGPITVTKAVTGTGPNSSVTILGASTTPGGNAVTVGAAITGDTIDVGVSGANAGSVALNAAVGNTASANVTVTAGGLGGSINGIGLVTGTNVTLSAPNATGGTGNIGTAAKPINTAAGTLSVNASGTGTSAGGFVTQKGNLTLGSSNDGNLVVKVTGNLDVAAGATVSATSFNLSSTGTTTVDGTINGTGTGGMTNPPIEVITSGGAFTVSKTGSVTNANPNQIVTINVTGASLVNGNISVGILDLKGSNGLTIAPNASVTDGTDNITLTGPLIIDGQLGRSDGSTNFNVNVNGNVVIGETSQNAKVIGNNKIEGLSIINYVNLQGSVDFIGTGAGNAFQNYGDITGLNVIVNTTNPLGVIYNAPGAIIEATQSSLANSPAPTLTLNSYGVNNQGTIGAVGLVGGEQGVLTFNSLGALTISGVSGGFLVGAFNAVTLNAKGNVTIGGVAGGVTVNPFSNFSAANELGSFTVNTTGTFSSPFAGISVLSNAAGTFGGTISITASNVLYNGAGTLTGPFALSAIGAGPTVATKDPITLILSGTQGIKIGNAVGDYSVNAEGFSNTSLNTISTPGALTLDTSAFNVHQESLFLEGDKSVLITGNLDEGTQSGTNLTIKTLSTSAFLVGGATTNGVTGITNGQGLSAGNLTLDVPGAVTVGVKSGVGAVLTGSNSVVLNSQSLLVNALSDVVGLSMTLNVALGNTTYTNLNPNGQISASAVNINDYGGMVSLVGPGGTTVRTVLSVGFNPDGPGPNGTFLIAGGTFDINAQGLTIPTKGITFNATGGIDGGQVILNLNGGSTGGQTITIGTGNGQISADVHAQVTDLTPQGAGEFELTNAGNIIGIGLYNATMPSSSAIQFGPVSNPQGAGGLLSLVADGFGANGAGTTVSVSGVNGMSLNLFQLSSNSPNTLKATNAGAGGNGIVDNITIGTGSLEGGNLVFTNSGPVATNGANLLPTSLVLTSNTSVDVSGNASFTAVRALTATGFEGGTIQISAPFITVAKTGIALGAQGGQISGGNISIFTSATTTLNIGPTGTSGSNISVDVGDMMQSLTTGNWVAGIITLSNSGNIAVNGQGVSFLDGKTTYNPGGVLGVGGILTINSSSNQGLPSAPVGFLNLSNPDAISGLNFSSVILNTGDSAAFALANATAGTANGITASSTMYSLTAGNLTVNANLGSINTTGEIIQTYSLALNAPSVSFGASQTIAVQPDSKTVGFTGPGVDGGPTPTGNGGSILITSPSLNPNAGGPVTFSAEGAGTGSLTFPCSGGTVSLTDTAASGKPLLVNSSTYQFDVSNSTAGADLNTAGIVSISYANGNIELSGLSFTYGATGGTLNVTAQNIAVSNIANLSKAAQDTTGGLGLANITFTSSSATPFAVSGASPTGNGFTDVNPMLIATALTIANGGTGGVDFTGGGAINPHSLTITTPGAVTFTDGETVLVSQGVTPASSVGLGGSIAITAGGGLVFNAGAGPVTFNAAGNSNNGSAGTINISNGTTTPLAIGNATGDMAFVVSNSGTGASALAGSVTVSTAGNMTVNGNGLTYGPSQTEGNGSLSLSAANLLVSNVGATGGGLSTHPLSSITLTSNSATDFSFDAATVNGFADGTATTLTAQSVTIINSGGGGTTSGGINTVSGANGTTIASTGLSLSTPGAITLTSGGGLTVKADPTTGAGGSIALTAGTIAYSNPANATATLSAVGKAGTGGTITVTDSDSKTLNVSATTLNFVVSGSAAEPSGTVIISNTGNLAVNGNGLTFGPKDTTDNQGTGVLSLSAANVLLSNVAALSTNPLSSITLSSTSATNFSVGGATLNGIADTGATLTAGTVVINANASGSLSGGITFVPGGVTLAATHITLDTQNTTTFVGGSNITAVPVSTTNAGGTITVTTGAVAYNGNTGGVALNAEGGTAPGAGGLVTVTVASVNTLAIGANGLQFDVTDTGTSAGGTVSVTNGGGMTVDASKITLGTTFTASAGPILTLVANGALAISNAGGISPANESALTLSSDSIQTFALGGSGIVNGIQTNGLTLQAASVSIANHGGAVNMGTAVSVNGGTSLSLLASTDLVNIVLGGGTTSTAVTLVAGGNANVSVTDTSSVSLTSATVVGSLAIVGTGGNLTVGSSGPGFSASTIAIDYSNTAGTLSLGSLAATDGNLVVNGGGGTTGASLIDILSEQVITAYNGSIFLQNPNGAGTIRFEAGVVDPLTGAITFTTVHAAGALSLPTDGNVSIFIGPSGFTAAPGVTPNANQIYVYAPAGGPIGSVTYTDSAHVNGTINTNTDDILQGLGRSLAFTTDGHASSAITLGAFVQITADPPGISGASLGSVNVANAANTAAANSSGSVSVGSPVSGAAFATPVTYSGGNAANANTIVIPASVQTSGSGTANAVTGATLGSGLTVGGVNGSSLNTMTIANPGLTAGFLSSMGNGATAQNLTDNATDGGLTVSSGNVINHDPVTSIGTTSGKAVRSAASAATSRTLTGGVSSSQTDNYRRGPILLSPLHDEQIETPFGTVKVAANSVALIVSSDSSLAVYNLHDTHKNAVAVTRDGKTISVNPGRSAVFAKSNFHTFEEVNPARFVSYRGVASVDTNNDVKLYNADFDIRTMIHGLPALKELMKSETPQTRKVMNNMLKTAAILMQVSQSSEPYALYLTPEVTAYAASSGR